MSVTGKVQTVVNTQQRHLKYSGGSEEASWREKHLGWDLEHESRC